MNIIGDIGGQYDALLRLIDSMPKDEETVLLGDLNDRGLQSKEVIQYCIDNQIQSINSNHGHMMLEACKPNGGEYYEMGTWFYNGAIATCNSYNENWRKIIEYKEAGELIDYNPEKLKILFPKDHLEYLEKCPFYIEKDEFILTHAPHRPQVPLDKLNYIGKGFKHEFDFNSEYSIIWNRLVNKQYLPNKINVFGHNASNFVKVYTPNFQNGIKVSDGYLFEEKNPFSKGDIYAICIDTSSDRRLTGLNTNNMTLYSESY